MMFLEERYFQTLGGTESQQPFHVLYYFSCGDTIKDQSAGRFSPLRINHGTLVREFHDGRNRKFQTKYKKSRSGGEASEKYTVGAPVDFPCCLLSCLLLCGRSCYALSIISRRMACKNVQWFACTERLIMCQLWSVCDVSGVMAQTRASLPAVQGRMPLAVPRHAAGHGVPWGCKSGLVETPVMRILFFTNWDRARLFDGLVSSQQHLKLIFSNGIQIAPEWSNFSFFLNSELLRWSTVSSNLFCLLPKARVWWSRFMGFLRAE